jgi:hypothetical protein
MNIKSSNYIKRILVCLIANILIGITIAAMRVVNLGIDPFTSLIIGVSNLSKIPFRYIYPIINAVIIILIFFLNKPMIGIGTVINLLVIGPVADYSAALIENIYNKQTFISRIIILIIALIIMSMNVSIYTSTNIGVSAYDSLFITINKKKPKISLGIARIITDSISMIVGIIGKATLGIGTLLNVFLMGPMVEFFNKNVTNKLLKNII